VRAARFESLNDGNIKQNLFFAFVYNSIGVPSPPAFFIVSWRLVEPMIAAAAMSFQFSLSYCDALRLRNARLVE